jgi:hypothetical protein
VKRSWWTGISFLFLVGVGLRLWGWFSQMLLDDEWHALNFVFNRSLGQVALQQGLGANSIPVNLYTWIVLHSTGWSEPMLRLPSLLAGIAALIVVPVMVRRVWGDAVALVTAALLAISPVVIFYSRIARPYAPVMLLGSASVLFTLVWLKEGKRRDIVLSSVCGSFAIYYHLYAAIPVFAPLAVAVVAVAIPRLGLAVTSERAVSDLTVAVGILGVLVGVLVVLPNVTNPWWADVHGVDHATWQTAHTTLSLVAGTRHAMLETLTLALMLSGFFLIFGESKTVGLALAAPFFLFFLAMENTTQEGAHAAIQVARYGITFLPLSFIAIAMTAVKVGNLIRHISDRWGAYVVRIAAVSVWLPYLATSPLWVTYAYPNNFTNHSAFQYNYEPIRWEDRSPERELRPGVSMRYADIPRFYFDRSLQAKGIIEYPVMVGDQFNVYFYYQHFHRLPVMGGFLSSQVFEEYQPGGDFIVGSSPIDYVMSAIPKFGGRPAWRAMVDLNDTERLTSQFAGWLIVVHWNPLFDLNQDISPELPLTTEAAHTLTKRLGSPIFKDARVAVWQLR